VDDSTKQKAVNYLKGWSKAKLVQMLIMQVSHARVELWASKWDEKQKGPKS
jgi:hypothetical protein